MKAPRSRKILILGGARSGKTALSLKMGKGFLSGRKGLYVATAEPKDKEMEERIRCHRLERGSCWDTLEEPIEFTRRLAGREDTYGVLVIDCLTMWTANLMERRTGQEEEYFDSFCSWIDQIRTNIIVVSNEVGLGIVPDTPLARHYRDLLGILNQAVSRVATDVYLVVAGLTVRLKGEEI